MVIHLDEFRPVLKIPFMPLFKMLVIKMIIAPANESIATMKKIFSILHPLFILFLGYPSREKGCCSLEGFSNHPLIIQYRQYAENRIQCRIDEHDDNHRCQQFCTEKEPARFNGEIAVA